MNIFFWGGEDFYSACAIPWIWKFRNGDFLCNNGDYYADKDDDGDNDDYDGDDKIDDEDDNDVDHKNFGGQYNYDRNKDNKNNVNKTKQQ